MRNFDILHNVIKQVQVPIIIYERETNEPMLTNKAFERLGLRSSQFFNQIPNHVPQAGKTFKLELMLGEKQQPFRVATFTFEAGSKPLVCFMLLEDNDESEKLLPEAKLVTGEEKFRAIYDQAEHYIGLMDTDGSLLEANKTALDFGGITLDEVKGKKLWESFWWTHSDETISRAREAVRRAVKGEFIRFEERVQGADGKISVIDFSLKPIFNEKGKIILLLPEGRDITKQSELADKLHLSEHQLRLFVKHTPAAIAMFDTELRYLLASDRWYTEYGVEGKEIIGKKHYDVFPEISDDHHWREIHKRCLSGEVMRNERDPFEREDGQTDYIRWEIHPWYEADGVIGGIIMFTEVITESIRNQNRIQAEKTKVEKYLQLSGNIILILNTDGIVEIVNDKGCEVLGYQKNEIVGKSWVEHFIPGDQQADVEAIIKRLKSENPIANQAEGNVLTKEGTVKTIAWKNSLVRNADGEIVSLLASGEDVTASRAYEEKIFQQAQIINQIKVAVITTNFDGVALTWNPGAKEMFGYEDREILGHQISKLSEKLSKNYLEKVVYPELKKVNYFRIELAYSSSGGYTIYGNTTFTQQYDKANNVTGLIISVNDITTRVIAEQELQKNSELLSKAQTITQMGTWEWNVESDKLSWSDPLFHIFEVDKNSFNLTVQSYLSLIHPNDRKALEREFNALLTDPSIKSFKTEHRIITPDNKVKHIESIGYGEFTEAGIPKKLYGTALDISARKATEERITRLNEALEQRVEERTEQLRLANAEIKDSERRAKVLNTIISVGNEVSSIDTFLKRALQELLNYLGWEAGHLYMREENHEDSFMSHLLHSTETNNNSSFKKALQERNVTLNDFHDMLANKICKWESQVPASAMRLSALPGRYGYKTIFSMPVFHENKLYAVMEFYSRQEIAEKQNVKAFFRDAAEEMSSYITREKTAHALAESEEKFRQLAENIEQVLYLRTENSMLYLSPSFEEMYGISRKRIYTNTEEYQNLIYPEDRAEVQRQQRELYDQKTNFDMEYRITHPEKGLRWVHARSFMFKVENTNEYRIVGFVEDVTTYKQLTSQLVSARDEADRANKAKSEFLANMSHEIRTPLNAIIGFSDLIKSMNDDPRLKKQLEAIKSSSNSLLRLINDILDLSKIEANKLEINPKPLSFKWIFGEVMSIFEQTAEEKGVQLVMNIQEGFPEYLLLDEVRIRQILFNLLGNAIKFTDNGKIELLALAEMKSEDTFNISLHVKDTGMGIPYNQQEKIFESFTQQEGQNVKKTGGTGLGLAITRRLTEAMNGSISLKSQPGKGSEFVVEFKDIKRTYLLKKEEQQKQASELPLFDRGLVLVVDDNHHNVEMIKEFLLEKNLDVEVAFNGLEALNKVKKTRPDLVLMDIKMPVMDGLESTNRIKNDAQLMHIPVVAVTASAMKDSVEKIKQSAFDDYLLKPVEFVHLYQKLSKYFSSKESEQPVNKVEQSGDHKITLSKDKIEDLVKILEKDYYYQFESARNSRLINEIISFGKSLEAVSRQFNDDYLRSFALKILEHAEAFDTAKLYKTMENFPSIINEYKRIIN